MRFTTRSSPRSAPSGAAAFCALAMGVDSEVLVIPAEGSCDEPLQCRIENQPGELTHLGDVCAQRGVNVHLAGVVTAERGTILFSAGDEAAVRTALEGAGLEFTGRPALQVKCADQAGEAAKFGRKLADAGVNIEGLL